MAIDGNMSVRVSDLQVYSYLLLLFPRMRASIVYFFFLPGNE